MGIKTLFGQILGFLSKEASRKNTSTYVPQKTPLKKQQIHILQVKKMSWAY